MPPARPQPGERWSVATMVRSTPMDIVVANVLPIGVRMLSLDSGRSSVLPMQRFLENGSYRTSPITNLACCRGNTYGTPCITDAVLTYPTPHPPNLHATCPLHAPFGLTLSFLTRTPPMRDLAWPSYHIPPCPSCRNNSLAEDFTIRQDDNLHGIPWRVLQCRLCSHTGSYLLTHNHSLHPEVQTERVLQGYARILATGVYPDLLEVATHPTLLPDLETTNLVDELRKFNPEAAIRADPVEADSFPTYIRFSTRRPTRPISREPQRPTHEPQPAAPSPKTQQRVEPHENQMPHLVPLPRDPLPHLPHVVIQGSVWWSPKKHTKIKVLRVQGWAIHALVDDHNSPFLITWEDFHAEYVLHIPTTWTTQPQSPEVPPPSSRLYDTSNRHLVWDVIGSTGPFLEVYAPGAVPTYISPTYKEPIHAKVHHGFFLDPQRWRRIEPPSTVYDKAKQNLF